MDGVAHTVVTVELFPAIPAWVLAAGCAVLSIAWVLTHKRKAEVPGLAYRRGLLCAGLFLGFGALMAGAAALQRVLVFATNWPVWPVALAAALGIETVVALYAVERSIVGRWSRLLFGVTRVLLVLLVCFMLLQPVRVLELSESIQRRVAILIDESGSMRVADTRLTAWEKVRLGEAVGLAITARPLRLEDAAELLSRAQEALTPQADWLESVRELEPQSRENELEEGRRAFHEQMSAIAGTVGAQLERVHKAEEAKELLRPVTVRSATAIRTRLERDVALPLSDLVSKATPERAPAQWIRKFFGGAENKRGVSAAEGVEDLTNSVPDGDPPQDAVSLAENFDYLVTTVRRAIDVLPAVAAELRVLARDVDAQFYESLSGHERDALDSLTRRARLDTVADVLRAPGEGGGFLAKLSESHRVQLYTFSSDARARDFSPWLEEADGVTANAQSEAGGEEAGAAGETNAPVSTGAVVVAAGGVVPWPDGFDLADLDESKAPHLMTDVAGALEHVTAEIPARELGAVVVLSDGRHNAERGLEQVARLLALQRVPVSCVAFGAWTNSPTDAAIVGVTAPDVMYAGDVFRVSVNVKLDGLTGETSRVSLMMGDDEVDFEDVPLEGAADTRETVELVHEPESVGLARYRVVVSGTTNEVLLTNNEQAIAVNVVQDRTRLLLVEGRPSWEFRYIKNLFATRDPSVQLQYVLLEPDLVEGAPPRPVIDASASRDPEDSEATALPADLSEWMKFDVVILGDVSPQQVGSAELEALGQFVSERGGALVVIAGPHNMPHAFAESGLVDLLPVTFTGGDRALMVGPEKEYRVALTPEGRDSPLVRLSTRPEDNEAVWRRVPDLYWRHALLGAKESASILAYALPESAPAFMRADTFDEESFRMRQDFISKQALVVHHHYGRGRVLFLGFNRTWRLRYRIGDTYHHRFWGQVMRWATTDRPPFGNAFLRIGTGRTRYSPGERCRVRAKLTQPDFEPIVSSRVAVRVMSDGDLVARRDLVYEEGSAGVYGAELGLLDPGVYRLELEAADVVDLVGEDLLAEAACEFVVAEGAASEEIELAADMDRLSRLAGVTGGVLAGPAELARVLDACGPPVVTRTERRQYEIWNSWPLLLLIILLAGTEWFVRKRERLP